MRLLNKTSRLKVSYFAALGHCNSESQLQGSRRMRRSLEPLVEDLRKYRDAICRSDLRHNPQVLGFAAAITHQSEGRGADRSHFRQGWVDARGQTSADSDR